MHDIWRIILRHSGAQLMENDFLDYYEILQVSPNADTDTVDRVFRHLAKKFHPDNTASGDTEQFRVVMEAHKTLSDPEARAAYDVKHTDHWNQKWQLASEAANRTAFGDDRETRDSLLSLLYVQRRRTMKHPGMGELELAMLLRVPHELVEFHLWYLKAKGWVERLDTGMLAITARGVDQVEQGRLRLGPDRLLPYSTVADESAGGAEHIQHDPGHDRRSGERRINADRRLSPQENYEGTERRSGMERRGDDWRESSPGDAQAD